MIIILKNKTVLSLRRYILICSEIKYHDFYITQMVDEYTYTYKLKEKANMAKC